MMIDDLLRPARPSIWTRFIRTAYHRALLKSRKLRAVSRGGIRYSICYTDGFGKNIILYGVYERAQINYFFAKCKEFNCGIFLDVGANIGYYSLLAAKLQQFQQIHAVEASPVTYKRLQKHICINHMQDIITPHNIAASNTTKEVLLSGEFGEASISAAGTLKATAQPLDSLFTFTGKNLAIKMDVERHEIPALQGADQLLRSNNVFLQVEVLSHQVATIPYLLDSGWQLLCYHGGDFCFYRSSSVQIRQPFAR